MTDTDGLATPPAPLPAPATMIAAPPVAAPPPAPEKPRRNFWPWVGLLLGVLGFLILAAGEGYLWRLHETIPDPAPSIAVLQAQVADLQAAAARAAPAADSLTVQADLAQKYAALAAEMAAMQSELAADHGAVAQLVAGSANLTRLTAKIQMLNSLSAARMALDAGQPLGAMANAPPALRKFADAAPPTEAALRLGYPAAAAAANDASVAKATKNSVWRRATARLENLVTISDGDRVILGPPAAAITAQAQTELDAGDLAGAVATLGGLSDTTQAAMNPWLANARDLLAARAAIISMAGQN